MNRTGENGEVPQRNNRYFEQDNYWYYKTREGIKIGPFDSLLEAQSGASDFVDFVLHADPGVIQTLEKYRPAA